MADYFKQKKVIEDFKILEQEEYEVYGDAYMCQQYIRSYKAHISIFGHRELETLVPDIDVYLSAQDCWDMIEKQECFNPINKMS